jgi:Catalase
MKDEKTLTTQDGAPVAGNQNSPTASSRGPLLVQDWQLFEKHAHFNRERPHSARAPVAIHFPMGSRILAAERRLKDVSYNRWHYDSRQQDGA